MKHLALLCFGLLGFGQLTMAQTNVELLDQLVTESQSEHTVQQNARNSQATVSANESVNKSQMTTLKTTYRNVQSRFHTLGLVIDAAEIGFEATPVVNEIVAQQEQIISLCKNDPVLVALALNSEADFANQATLLAEYSLGLILSIGDVDQMKVSDRKMLFSYVVTELRRIDGASRGLLNSLNNFNAALKSRSLNPFSNFMNQDKQQADDIMENTKLLLH
jgi:hypothetical protein